MIHRQACCDHLKRNKTHGIGCGCRQRRNVFRGHATVPGIDRTLVVKKVNGVGRTRSRIERCIDCGRGDRTIPGMDNAGNDGIILASVAVIAVINRQVGVASGPAEYIAQINAQT